MLLSSPLFGIGVRGTVRVRGSDERNFSPRSYYFLGESALESGRDRKKQGENNERYASPCSQRKSDEKMLRLASVSVGKRKSVTTRRMLRPVQKERERGRTTRGMPRLVLEGKRREDTSPRFR